MDAQRPHALPASIRDMDIAARGHIDLVAVLLGLHVGRQRGGEVCRPAGRAAAGHGDAAGDADMSAIGEGSRSVGICGRAYTREVRDETARDAGGLVAEFAGREVEVEGR